MDPESEKQTPSYTPPPPVVSAPPPPPISPLDAIQRSAAVRHSASIPSENSVKVQILEDDEGDPITNNVSFNTRAIAAVIDWVLGMGIGIALLMILPAFSSKIAWIVAAAYWIVRDSLPFLGGQSIGKKAMKIKVVTLTDQSLIRDWQASIIRNGVLMIPFFALIEVYVLLTREDKPDRGRRLGDEWAKTKVISAPEVVVADKDL
jgi:uncharacterized RDD family membrane protein YckC